MDINLKIKYQIGCRCEVWDTGHDRIGNRCFPFNVILYVHSGSYCLSIKDKWRRFMPGEAFIIPPFTLHSVEIDEPCVISWAHISFQYVNGLDFLSCCTIPDVFNGDCACFLGAACNSMADSAAKNDIVSAMRLREQAYALLAVLLRGGAISYSLERHMRGFVSDVSEYIYNRLDTAISINALAGHFNFSVSSFRRKFEKHFHMSPLQFIQKRKLETACEYLLGEAISIAEVAEKVGYTDQLYFSRLFTKTYKVSPRQYRLSYFNSFKS